MEFSVKNNKLEKYSNACIMLGIFEPRRLSSIAKELDKISKGYISTLLDSGELEGKIGQTLLLYHVPYILSTRILLVGCGKKHPLNRHQYKQIINKTINTILYNTGTIEAVCFLTELHVKGCNIYWKVRQAVETIEEMLYTFNKFKNKKNDRHRLLRKIIFNVSTSYELINSQRAILHGLAIAHGIKMAKDLSNMPPNICNSSYIASKVHKLADQSNKTTVHLINEQQMQTLGMNAYLAVGQGSANESLMSILEYKGNPNTNIRPIVLIGKGLTFDTGGICIKPDDKMHEMKYDMCGAATVYGIMQIVIKLQLPLNIIGVLANCENMVDSRAFRPGDVLTTLSGQTVEVLNTDAEGRLVLCDALTYVERFNPELVIDIATLTGACVIALGHHLTGLMSNYNPLAHELINAAKQSGDHVWRLPLGDEFQKQLQSNIADMANIGGRPGGAITAGCFLSNFTSKYHWAHLDIAGTAWHSSNIKNATGRPVAMLSQFLLNRAEYQDKNNYK